MGGGEFVAYVGDADIHDGTIVDIQRQGDRIGVVIQGAGWQRPSGCRFVVEFLGVQSVKSNRPIGMTLYSLSEMKSDSPFRRFVFANWHDEDDASLEIVAREFRVLETA